MNKSYMYANVNIHIFTDNEKRVIDYNDNFEEQLVSENKLEIVEKLIMRNEQQIEILEEKKGFVIIVIYHEFAHYFVNHIVDKNSLCSRI